MFLDLLLGDNDLLVVMRLPDKQAQSFAMKLNDEDWKSWETCGDALGKAIASGFKTAFENYKKMKEMMGSIKAFDVRKLLMKQDKNE